MQQKSAIILLDNCSILVYSKKMKHFLLIPIAVCAIFFTRCAEDHYEYLDEDKICVFSWGDT